MRHSSWSSASRSSSVPIHVSNAVPAPYQPGSMIRAWLHENTHGMARRSSIRSEAVRDAGRLPILRAASSWIGVTAR